MQSRLLPYATIAAAVTAIALTALPWFDLKPLGLDVSWNGLGMSSDDALTTEGVADIAPAGRGWLVIAACAVSILAALISLMPSPAARPFAQVANTIGAVAAVLGALVPIIILANPDWFYGDLLDQLGAAEMRDELSVSAPVLVSTAVAMLLTALFCGVSAAQDRSAAAEPGVRR